MAAPRKISIDDAVKVLNTMVAADPVAMKALVRSRVSCNQKIGDHPTAQVVAADEKGLYKIGLYKIGLLGVLNAIFSTEGSVEHVAAEYVDDAEEKLIRFCKILKRSE